MAAVNWLLPLSRWHLGVAASYTNFTMSSSGHRFATVFFVNSSVTPTAVLLRLGVKTGTTPTYQVAIQGLNASGHPNGSNLCTPATFSPSSLGWSDNSTRWITVSGASSLSPGTPYCLVVTHSSGTVDGSNNASFSAINTSVSPSNFTSPYYLSDANVGTWTATGNIAPVFGGVRDGSTTHGLMLASSVVNGSLGSAGNRQAQKFALPSGVGQSVGVLGLTIQSMTMPAGGSVILGIWDGAGTAIASVTLDSDHAGNTAANRAVSATFSSVATLSVGTTYYAGVERVGSTEPAPRYFDHADARDLEAYPFGAGACVATWNGSTWSDVATGLMPVTLKLSDWTVAAGGGLLRHPGMGGGFLG
jgi:hypothetical protein